MPPQVHPAAFKCPQQSVTLNITPWLLQDWLREQEAILNIEKSLLLSFTVFKQEQTMHFPIEHLLLEFFSIVQFKSSAGSLQFSATLPKCLNVAFLSSPPQS